MIEACHRCGVELERRTDGFELDGVLWCGAACAELGRRGIPYEPEEAPLRAEGKERRRALESSADAALDLGLDARERQSDAALDETIRQQQLSRYSGDLSPQVADRWGRLA